MVQARQQLTREGLTITTRHGEVRSHPCASIERDSAIRFARLLRELGLADEAENPRPPRLSGRYAGRR
jgi:phage terminase small subunit